MSRSGAQQKNKKKLTGEKIDEDIDFNQLSLGDSVTSEQLKASAQQRLKQDLVGEDTLSSFAEPKETGPAGGAPAPEDSAFLEKYKHKTAIGSEDLGRGQAGGKKDLSQFEGRSAIGSDDVFGKSKPATASSSPG